MLSRLRGRRGQQPRLSVVVPVYNVEAYLAECLDSILAQTYPDLEVVLVDDGSTDGSLQIAQQYVDRHPGFSIVRQANAGLSAARNTGVRQARGEFLAFADSDDAVPPYAYELMVSTLDESGSDFVVGSVLQGVPGDAVEPAWLRPVHRQRRLGIRADDLPEVISNVFAWSKVFRRAFWDRADLSFPEGVRYEDQVAMTNAYLLADALDVLVRPVYLWRTRSDGSSITQRRHELADLEDRILTKQMTTALVEGLATPPVREQWLRRELPGDLPLYLREIPGCDDRYWTALQRGIRAMVEVDAIAEWRIPVQHRLAAWLAAHGRRGEATAVMEQMMSEHGAPTLTVRGSAVWASFAAVDDGSVPAALLRLGDHEMVFDARLIEVAVEGDRLSVTGWALIRGVPPGELPTSLTAAWRSNDGAEVAAAVVEWVSPDVTAWVGAAGQIFDRSGFTATVDAALLAAGPEPAEPRQWRLVLRRTVAEITREGQVRSQRRDPSGAAVPLPQWTGAGYRAELAFRPGQDGLSMTVSRPG